MYKPVGTMALSRGASVTLSVMSARRSIPAERAVEYSGNGRDDLFTIFTFITRIRLFSYFGAILYSTAATMVNIRLGSHRAKNGGSVPVYTNISLNFRKRM